jgi:hypothetical protein
MKLLLERERRENKKYLMTSVFFLACLIFFIIFPSRGAVQGYTKGLFFLVVLPAFYVKMILRRNLSDYGFSFKLSFRELLWSALVLTISLATTYALYKYTALRNTYSLPPYIFVDFRYYLFYELLLINLSLFIFSYYFFGIVLFHLEKKLPGWSVILQSTLFFAASSIGSGLKWQMASNIILSLLGGFLARRTSSVFYPYLTILFYFLLFDAYIIYTSK